MQLILDKMQSLERACDAGEWQDVGNISMELHTLIEQYFEDRTDINESDRKILEDVLSRYTCLTTYLTGIRDTSRDKSIQINRSSKVIGKYSQVSQAG